VCQATEPPPCRRGASEGPLSSSFGSSW
jgi:hypothetical protein